MGKVRKPRAKIQENPEKTDWADRHATRCYVSSWLTDWRYTLEKMELAAQGIMLRLKEEPDGILAEYVEAKKMYELYSGLDTCCNAISGIIPPGLGGADPVDLVKAIDDHKR